MFDSDFENYINFDSTFDWKRNRSQLITEVEYVQSMFRICSVEVVPAET